MGTWELDVRTGAVAWSDVARRHYGVGPGAPATAARFLDLVVEEDRRRVGDATAAVVDGRASDLDVEFRVRRPDGEARWLRSVARLSRDGGGLPDRVVGTVVDVTDRRRYEDGLVAAKEAAEEARAAAEEAARLKASLLANMSHEVRTPLTGVLGYADLLAETASGDDAEFVGAIQRGATRLLHTLDSVLELSQIDAGARAVRLRPVDVREAVAEAVALLRPQAADAGLALSVRVPDEAVVAGADPHALTRVVVNLVSNAVKYTEAGSVTASAAALPGGGAEIRVVDTGTGIAPAFLPHLFEEFRQESEGDGRRYEGAGLGLAIVSRLVEAMGGEVAVESEKGAGSTFTVRLRPPRPSGVATRVDPDGGTAGDGPHRRPT